MEQFARCGLSYPAWRTDLERIDAVSKLAQWAEREAQLQREAKAVLHAIYVFNTTHGTNAEVAQILSDLSRRQLAELKQVQHHVEVLRGKAPADFFSHATPNIVFN
jgi:hypothetical protein